MRIIILSRTTEVAEFFEQFGIGVENHLIVNDPPISDWYAVISMERGSGEEAEVLARFLVGEEFWKTLKQSAGFFSPYIKLLMGLS